MTAKARFHQAAVTRALKGAQAAGMTVASVRVSPEGEIVIYAKGEDRAERPNPLDDLLLNGS